MNYVYMIIFPAISLVVLFILTRLIGYRQMSQLSLFDYINGITIGSIASEVAVADKDNLLKSLIALVIFGLVTFISAIITDKSIKARRELSGTPIILIENGKFFDRNFSKAHLDLSEFTMQARNQGYFDISQIDTAILEPNGIISILPKSQSRPVTPEDMNFVLERDPVWANVLIDGNVMKENLSNCGLDEKWLDRKLKEFSVSKKEVFLAVATNKGDFSYYLKEGKKDKDVFA